MFPRFEKPPSFGRAVFRRKKAVRSLSQTAFAVSHPYFGGEGPLLFGCDEISSFYKARVVKKYGCLVGVGASTTRRVARDFSLRTRRVTNKHLTPRGLRNRSFFTGRRGRRPLRGRRKSEERFTPYGLQFRSFMV